MKKLACGQKLLLSAKCWGTHHVSQLRGILKGSGPRVKSHLAGLHSTQTTSHKPSFTRFNRVDYRKSWRALIARKGRELEQEGRSVLGLTSALLGKHSVGPNTVKQPHRAAKSTSPSRS